MPQRGGGESLPETRSFAPAVGSLLAIALLAAVPAAPARAALPGEQAPPTRLHLTVQGQRTVTLRCDPPGGSHPRARDACRALAAAGGDLTKLAHARDVACVAVYDPVAVRARGTWRGRPMTYDATFSNRCTMTAATGAVFAF